MIAAIHQPNFVPWIGYFYKIYKADVFVILDDVQYIKNSFINRNRIKTPTGEQWLTIPVKHSGFFGQNINEVEIQDPLRTFSKIKSTLRLNYCKAPFYNEVIEIIEPIFNPETTQIAVLNEALIRAIVNFLEINTPILRSGDLENIVGESSERLVNICITVGADVYLAGFGSKKYQDSEVFENKGISSTIYKFKHPVYRQQWKDFIPSMSILDLLFNEGTNSINLLKECDEIIEI